MRKRIISEISDSKWVGCCQLNPVRFFVSRRITTLGGGEEMEDPPYADVPRPSRRKSERKPYPTPMKILIRRAKDEREARKAQPCRVLEDPPENGLLVPELIGVAHQVSQAQQSVLHGIRKLVDVVPVQRCRFCFEVHIGHLGHDIRTCTGPKSGSRGAKHVWRKGRVEDVVYFPKCFHLSDRVGKPRVGHDERFDVQKIPAILELCIQAGVDLEKYPTKRRTRPVYCIEGRIVDFEPESENDETRRHLEDSDFRDRTEKLKLDSNSQDSGHSLKHSNNEEEMSLKELSTTTLESWIQMISGAKRIMEKYTVQTCGYCPEVQVGPKGHKVRMCKASKHQSRNGLHAWQEATMDDLVGPNYVWHVNDQNRPALDNSLKRYYGKAPAIVELCVQGGAPIPVQYESMMRLDVVPPGRDEVDLVA